MYEGGGHRQKWKGGKLTVFICVYVLGYAGMCIYTGVHITGTQVRMGENNQQCVMPLRAFAYLTDLILIVSNQQHVISVSTCRVHTSSLPVSRTAELRYRRVRAHRDEKKSLAPPPPPPPTLLGSRAAELRYRRAHRSAVMRAHR